MENNWHNKHMRLARAVASYSKDPSTKVGAVIADSKNRLVSLGFNGFPRGIDDDPSRLEDRETKYKLVLHAEENALLFAQRSLDGCTIYTWPFPPCTHCALLIIQSGIKTIVAPTLRGELKERWGKQVAEAKKLFKEARVEWINIDD